MHGPFPILHPLYTCIPTPPHAYLLVTLISHPFQLLHTHTCTWHSCLVVSPAPSQLDPGLPHSSALYMGLFTPYTPHHAWTFYYSPTPIYMHPHSTLCMSSGNTHLTSFQLFHTHTCTWHSCLVACHHDAMHLPSYTTNDIHCL